MDWEHISTDHTLSEAFLREHAKDINWDIICRERPMTASFIEAFYKHIKWRTLSFNTSLSLPIIEKYFQQLDKHIISQYQTLSEPFIEIYREELSWKEISYKQKLSIPFMERAKNYIDWSFLSLNTHFTTDDWDHMPISILEKIDWNHISLYQPLSFAFVMKHFSNMNLGCLKGNKRISFTTKEYEKIAEEHEKKMKKLRKNYADFIEKQQKTFPNWIVQDHGAGGHIEMMKEFIGKDKRKILVFIWNDQTATVFRHPFDTNRYVSLEDWNDPIINEHLWNNQNEKTWITLMSQEDTPIAIYSSSLHIFTKKTIQHIAGTLQKIRELKKGRNR